MDSSGWTKYLREERRDIDSEESGFCDKMGCFNFLYSWSLRKCNRKIPQLKVTIFHFVLYAIWRVGGKCLVFSEVFSKDSTQVRI